MINTFTYFILLLREYADFSFCWVAVAAQLIVVGVAECRLPDYSRDSDDWFSELRPIYLFESK